MNYNKVMLFGGYTSVFGRNSFSKTIKFFSLFRKSAYISTALLSLLALAILCPLYLVPDSSEATAGTATESTLTFAFIDDKNTASVSLNVTDSNGSFATSTSDELAEFRLTTNNATGYTLNLKTTDATNLVSGANSIASISASKTADNFILNSWGLLPSKYNSVSNTTNYYPASNEGFTMDTTSAANTTANTYTIGLGIKADFTVPTGTYTNSTIVAEYVANPVNYSITYDKGNISGTPSNIPAIQSGQISAASIALSSTSPSITGYNFTGWCLGTVATTDDVDSCSGTTFQPSGSFGIDQTINNTATLHAMWSIKTFTITKQYKLQDATGNYPSSYTGDGTVTVNYGGSYTYTISATTTHQQASQTISNVTSAQTISLDVLRNTRTVSLTKGTGISAVVVTGTGVKTGSGTASATVYYGGAVTIAATLTSGYDWVNWTGSATYTNQSQSINSVTSNLSFTANGKMDPCKNKTSLYDLVSCRSKGTQTAADLQADITTANSGVYEYNDSVFGTASDAANTSKIYYYRGILDETVGSYGSDGDGKAWPNYVILQAGSSKATTDTCWRIVRTTGSGGIKMIYNGKWTGSTCANATEAAQVTTQAFDDTASSSGKSIVGVGYTYNASYKSTTTATAYSTLFGSNTSYSGNSTASTMKTYLEGTFWSTISSYESKLEKSAGWCNDRTLNTGTSWTSPMSDNTNVNNPYVSRTYGNTAYYFGARIRNRTTAQKPTLTCPRSNADLYTTSSATNGNKQLGKPVALLTADEMSFAGSGSPTASDGSGYNANSYLYSGSSFWLLSPGTRSSDGGAGGFYLYSNGDLSSYYVYLTFGVRPAISLVHGTTIYSGSGTATDPWVVR